MNTHAQNKLVNLIIKIVEKQSCRSLKTGFYVISTNNNSATEHATTKLLTSFHSESTAHSNDINISDC